MEIYSINREITCINTSDVFRRGGGGTGMRKPDTLFCSPTFQ